ncbi:MAG: Asp23/Gls24 family envelope stress response protein [Clostridiales bacterium]|nr:Asp23/Gls24 family envelope stress response protein [Clostridiales bacterium]
MAARLPSELGVVDISESVIAKLAGITATECLGVLGLAAADGWTDLLKKDSVDKGVRVNAIEEGKVKIDISLVVQYGVSIKAVAENVISSVRYHVENMTGLKVADINVIIRGIRV